MKENYDGYMFTPTQSKRLFNTTLVVYFLDQLFEYEEVPDDLIDGNSQPSEYGLDIISKSPLSQQIIDGLYQNGEKGIYIPERVSKTIVTRDMMQLLQTNSLYILSFLYYLGALTQTYLTEGKNIGTVFKIPNRVIKSLFIEYIKKRLYINDRIQIELTQSVNSLVDDKSIEPICKLIKQKVLSHLKGNDIDHSSEDMVKTSFLLGFNLSGRNINPINEYQKDEDQTYTEWSDLVSIQEKYILNLKILK